MVRGGDGGGGEAKGGRERGTPESIVERAHRPLASAFGAGDGPARASGVVRCLGETTGQSWKAAVGNRLRERASARLPPRRGGASPVTDAYLPRARRNKMVDYGTMPHSPRARARPDRYAPRVAPHPADRHQHGPPAADPIPHAPLPRHAGTDQLLLDIADYVVGYEIKSRDAVKTARYAVLDAMACSMLSLNFPECAKLLGPVVPGATVTHGAHVPGTDHDVDPVTAAHNFSTCVRWLDYNDTWLASEWVHPSDVVGAIVPLAEYLTRVRLARALPPLTMKDVIVAVIKAYEVCGVLALENSLNQIGVDHSLMTRVAVASTCTRMLGGGRREVCDASSQAFADGAGLRCFRHYPNNGTRKGWAAGDACARGVWIALTTMRGEMGMGWCSPRRCGVSTTSSTAGRSSASAGISAST